MLGSLYFVYICLHKDYEALAMAQSQETPDPLAKNFKCPKVVAVGAEVPLGDALVEQVTEAISKAVPPSYGEQGKPRGRKPKKDKKVEVKGKRGGKAKKAKRGKAGKRRGILKASASKHTASGIQEVDEPSKKLKKKST